MMLVSSTRKNSNAQEWFRVSLLVLESILSMGLRTRKILNRIILRGVSPHQHILLIHLRIGGSLIYPHHLMALAILRFIQDPRTVLMEVNKNGVHLPYQGTMVQLPTAHTWLPSPSTDTRIRVLPQVRHSGEEIPCRTHSLPHLGQIPIRLLQSQRLGHILPWAPTTCLYYLEAPSPMIHSVIRVILLPIRTYTSARLTRFKWGSPCRNMKT